MYCLASRYQAAPEKLDEVVRIFKEEAAPLVSRQPGFKGVYLLTKANGVFMVLNVWETEEQANGWPQNPEHQKVVAGLRPLLSGLGAAARDGYNVQVHVAA